jgi:hypothetical protein
MNGWLFMPALGVDVRKRLATDRNEQMCWHNGLFGASVHLVQVFNGIPPKVKSQCPCPVLDLMWHSIVVCIYDFRRATSKTAYSTFFQLDSKSKSMSGRHVSLGVPSPNVPASHALMNQRCTTPSHSLVGRNPKSVSFQTSCSSLLVVRPSR